ncbi:hypothetical protein FA13DRAFT_1800068, partial [Coprinellus micaceus]
IEAELNGKYNGHLRRSSTSLAHGTAALTHVIQIQKRMRTPELLSITDFSAEAAVRNPNAVSIDLPCADLRLPIRNRVLPSEAGPSEGLELLANPHDTAPLPGWHYPHWHDDDTAGNNVIAYKAINKLHDIAYRYGFTEAAFNFQDDNFGKGGSGNDRVLMSVQDSLGPMTLALPPLLIGNLPHVHLDLDHPQPRRLAQQRHHRSRDDHGITKVDWWWNPVASRPPSPGVWVRAGPTLSLSGLSRSLRIQGLRPRSLVTNNVKGIRAIPLLHNATTNPLRYSKSGATPLCTALDHLGNVLHQVYAALVAHVQPTFTTGRDAWIQADANRYGGANRCLIWKAFASRGVGVNAANYVDNFDVPAGC